MEKEVAYYLGVVKREFDAGMLDEDMFENVDETHFVVNMDNGRTLAFVGCNEVKYADVSSGGDVMTMMVRITGDRNAIIEPRFIVFQKRCENPLFGVSDDVPGVSYRTGSKCWMDQRVFLEWLSEPRAIRKAIYGRQIIIFWIIARAIWKTLINRNSLLESSLQFVFCQNIQRIYARLLTVLSFKKLNSA